MNELVNLVVSQLGVNQNQATGGLGAIMKLAQEHLGTDFSQIEKYLPQVQSLISQAPTAATGTDGGLAGVVGSALSAFGMGNSKVAGLAQLAGQFKSLNLDADMITKFAPIVTGYLQQQGGTTAVDLIQKFLKG